MQPVLDHPSWERSSRMAFDAYARRSDLAEATPDAVDISDLTEAGKAATETELQRRLVEAEQCRLRSQGP